MVTHLNPCDEDFVNNVNYDIDQFLKKRHNNGILLFPPVNNYRRFLIHQACENFRQQYDLITFSVGQGSTRRTVVCFKNQLINPLQFACTSTSTSTTKSEKRRNTLIKDWRADCQIESSRKTPQMGVEKHSSVVRSKTPSSSSVGIYRPPALRNLSTDTTPTDNTSNISCSSAIAATSHTLQLQATASATTAGPTTTSTSFNNTPMHPNENETINNSNTEECAAAATEATSRRSQVIRRERRPDRAVYIPRARRSQTTPPAATTAATTTAITSTTPTTTAAAETLQATSTVAVAIIPRSPQVQSSITTETTSVVSVAISSSPKSDEVSLMKSSKSMKSNASVDKKEHKAHKHKSTSAEATKNSKKSLDSHKLAKTQAENRTVTKASNQNCDSEKELKNIVVKDQKLENSSSNEGMNKTNKKVENGDLPFKVVKETEKEKPGLLIEDIITTENGLEKFDIETQELQRASKEINRSNRRIIKQTFVSNVLEIPEKLTIENIETTTATMKLENLNTPNSVFLSAHSKPHAESNIEEQEDDWETMFNENGECLDPRIMEELTAQVGKVKIETPKMDYSLYLTKQAILSDEEFPHVLEVSGFPVEFKNQDLMMVFSQYKDSGFDIKWVDDTHALAVFSSSRIAAEVLTMGHPFVVLKPLVEATVESRTKAKKCAESLQPYRQRPETCAALARRLVSSALGVRLKTAAEDRENEKRVLREAKERKLLAAKQRDEAWES